MSTEFRGAFRQYILGKTTSIGTAIQTATAKANNKKATTNAKPISGHLMVQ